MNKKLREEEIVDVAYQAAESEYNSHRAEMRSLRIDKDDYLQDAVMYILNLHRKKYMKIDKGADPYPMVKKMLGRFTKNKFQTDATFKDRNKLTLDRPLGDEDGASVYADRVPSKFNNPEQVSINQEIYEDGKKILSDIIEEFDVVPYKTNKYVYKGSHPKLGRTLKLSEYNIGRLLLIGENEYEILKVYKVNTNNIGASSQATFVHRKVKTVINKLATIINELPKEKINSVKAYLAKI